MPQIALLMLADARFPAGGHAHSGGVEVAVADDAVTDPATLREFLAGRLRTQGLTQAALAAAACAAVHASAAPDALRDLDAHADARHPAEVQRRVSRAQGRAVLRAGRAVWPAPVLEALAAAIPGGAHQAVATGAVAASAGLDQLQVAAAVAYAAVAGPASAALRLLGLDPYAVAGVVSSLAGACEDVAALAAEVPGDWTELPAAGGPLLDAAAIRHELWEVRLFAS
ncbi:MAG TPA: urease accessory UreF family protein [Sporichthyaceae bacterium]|jgi:urease accessory protein|nr:urease accessory UreF family protein [Sporichthyaceae bacterium]